jgi:hypothetical protein
MGSKSLFTKFLASSGTVLACFPILAPLLLSASRIVQQHNFRLDYLMPAELFPAALLGGALLLWAALRLRSRRRLIGWGLGIAVSWLVGGQVIAVVSGLTSGQPKPVGWVLAIIIASLVIYVLAVVAVAVGGVLLRDLFKPASGSA